MLNENGKLIGDFTVSRYARGQVPADLLAGRGRLLSALVRDARRWTACVCRGASMDYPGLSDRRPASARELMQKLVRDDLSNAAFPFLSFAQARHRHDPGAGRPRQLHRRARLRDLGASRNISARCTRCCSKAGEPLGLTQFGMRALLCLRLEKSFGTWFREYRPIYGAVRGGARPLRRSASAAASSAREAAAAEKESGGKLRLCDLRRRGDRRRRDRRRADLARRQGDRLGDVGRLRPLRRQVAGDGLYREGPRRSRRTASRSRSSASAGRRGGWPRRPTIPRASECGL